MLSSVPSALSTVTQITSGSASVAGWAVTPGTNTTDTNILSSTFVGGSEKTLSVYIYFDGEDTNVFSDNTLAGLDTLNVQFELGLGNAS